MRRSSSWRSSLSAAASRGIWSVASASSLGFTQMESTGVLHRERLAVAVGDGAAVRGNLEHAREARIALAGEEAVIDQLQVDRAPGEPERARRERGQEQRCAPAERARVEVACTARFHGAMISMSFGGGIAMCSRVLATRSTNAWVDHALCSSCSWPHSISRLSRRALSASSWMNSSRARCLQ